MNYRLIAITVFSLLLLVGGLIARLSGRDPGPFPILLGAIGLLISNELWTLSSRIKKLEER